MHLIHENSKKRKRGERVFRFKTFCEPGHPTHFNGTFQENIRALLEFGDPETSVHGGKKCWSFQLELHHPPASIRLFVIEEAVGMSVHRRCHHCRSVGWGHHMICNKRFHFVLPTKETSSELEGWNKEANGKGSDAATVGSKLMNLQGHLMHGVVHSNGFGHLLRVNGIEGGSEFVSGHRILDLWDRICTGLRLRKVSLTDVARKGTMDLRLIHGVAHGESWFGRWGYKFGHGSYGVTQHTYKKSIEALQSFPLCILIPHFSRLSNEISVIVAKYQAISNHNLRTLGDLFRFMLELKARLPPNTLTATDYHGIINESSCRWSAKRVEMAAQVIVEALKKAEFKWVPRQEVRDMARAYIGDTGLLDYVLKSLGNHVVGNYMVRRMVNPVTKVLEYCLEDISNDCSALISNPSKMRVRFQITKVQLMKDLWYLYKHILKEQRSVLTTGVFSAIPMVVRIVLDTKHLIKDYQGELLLKNEDMKLMCAIGVRIDGIEVDGRRKKTPTYEPMSISNNATIGELKRGVGRYFREMYWGLKNFEVESVVGVDGKDSDLVFGLIESGRSIVVEGRITKGDEKEEGIYEGGKDDYIVGCPCGAKEEDGEPMIACDICEVSQHKRCNRIPNSEEVPRVFLCSRCERDIISFPPILY